jgi:hypothetical protein
MTKKSNVSKVGSTVKWTRKNGEKATGRVTGVKDQPNGRWVVVNTAAPRKPVELSLVRESQLTT